MTLPAIPYHTKGLDHVVLRAGDIDVMLEFYRDVLGLPVAKHNETLGLWHLQAGDSMIDLININGPLGRDGLLPSTKAQNGDHLALKITPFDSDALRAYFEAHGVEVGPDRIRFGANGDGPSIHLRDPEGNGVELKGL